MVLLRMALGTLLLAFFSNSSVASWKSRPPEQWTIDDVAELLERSPWANLVMITVLDRVLEKVEPRRSFIHFCWIAEPIDLAIQQVRNRNLRSDPFAYTPFWCDVVNFYLFYDAAMKLQREEQSGDPRPFYVLVHGDFLADLIHQEGRENMEKAYLSSPVGNLRASRFFYGIQRSVYTRDERGITSARVDVEILKRGKPAGKRKPIPVDKRPPGRVVYEFLLNFPENHEVSALLIVFNRAQTEKVIFDENTEKITVIIPLGNRSLRAEFRPKKMRFNGKPCM
jgi:hypothetical protein